MRSSLPCIDKGVRIELTLIISLEKEPYGFESYSGTSSRPCNEVLRNGMDFLSEVILNGTLLGEFSFLLFFLRYSLTLSQT